MKKAFIIKKVYLFRNELKGQIISKNWNKKLKIREQRNEKIRIN